MGSDDLFAMPSFVAGCARTLDLFATYDTYNGSPNGEIADRRALRADWQVVGNDLVEAMKTHDAQPSTPPADAPVAQR